MSEQMIRTVAFLREQMELAEQEPPVQIFEPVVFTQRERVQLQPGVRIDSFVKIEGGDGVSIGRGVHVASFVHLNIGGGLLIIDDYAAVASGAKIITGSNLTIAASMSASAPPELQAVKRGSVKLGKFSCVLTNAVVVPGVTLGRGALSFVGNGILELVRETDDVLVYVESDLIWNAGTVLQLIGDLQIPSVDVVAPLVFAGESFYDIWGFRGMDGERFSPAAPYHSSLAAGGVETLAEISSAGSCLVMKGAVAAAVERVGGRMIHLGPNLYLGDHVESYTDIDDIYLAALYRQCRFVSGLRRGEGFELPAAEGLLCGCRPILYDQPHYRLWYDKWGRFIPEESQEVVESALVRIFKDSLDPTVTESEIRQASERFHWESVTSRFWERILFGAGIGSVGAAS
jgi:acetyltransferase-like isoleucine patch superfamily enzyme